MCRKKSVKTNSICNKIYWRRRNEDTNLRANQCFRYFFNFTQVECKCWIMKVAGQPPLVSSLSSLIIMNEKCFEFVFFLFLLFFIKKKSFPHHLFVSFACKRSCFYCNALMMMTPVWYFILFSFLVGRHQLYHLLSERLCLFILNLLATFCLSVCLSVFLSPCLLVSLFPCLSVTSSSITLACCLSVSHPSITKTTIHFKIATPNQHLFSRL